MARLSLCRTREPCYFLETRTSDGRGTVSFIAPALVRLRTNCDATILAPYSVPLFKIPLADDDCEDDDGAEFCASSATNLTPPEDSALGGLRDLEDAEIDAEWNNAPLARAFSKVIEIDGKPVNKARALAQRFLYQKTTSSADRLRRVAQTGRYEPSSALANEEEQPDEPFLSIFDPVASLLVWEQKVSLCIGAVNGLTVDTQSWERVAIRLLPEMTARDSFQVLHLLPTSTRDHTERNDWRSARQLPAYRFVGVPGLLIYPMNPFISVSDTGSPRLLLDSNSLRTLTSTLRDRLARAHVRLIPKAKASLEFPYREASG